MNKIDEILQKHTACEGTCECGCGLVEAMSEFGKICFDAGRTLGDIHSISNYMKYREYEDFLKEVEDE